MEMRSSEHVKLTMITQTTVEQLKETELFIKPKEQNPGTKARSGRRTQITQINKTKSITVCKLCEKNHPALQTR